MGSLFGKTKAPKVEVQAPAVAKPVAEPAEIELGADSDETFKKNKKGKKQLKIDRDDSVTRDNTGLNTLNTIT